MSRTNPVYLSGLSGDLFVESPDFGSGRAALAMDMLSFCTECGCVVYRRDLHDAWHRAESRLAVGGEGSHGYCRLGVRKAAGNVRARGETDPASGGTCEKAEAERDAARRRAEEAEVRAGAYECIRVTDDGCIILLLSTHTPDTRPLAIRLWHSPRVWAVFWALFPFVVVGLVTWWAILDAHKVRPADYEYDPDPGFMTP